MLSISWSAAPAMPQGLQDNDGGVIEGHLVMVGGFCHGVDDDWKPGKYPRGFLGKAWALDLENASAGWMELPDFPGAPRQEMFAATVDDEIYLWGGFNYTAPYTYRDGYRLSRHGTEWSWTRLPDLPRAAAAGNTEGPTFGPRAAPRPTRAAAGGARPRRRRSACHKRKVLA